MAEKIISLGLGVVKIMVAHEEGKELENEVLIVDDGESGPVGCDVPNSVGVAYVTSDPQLLVRFVVVRPEGAQVLIDALRTVIANIQTVSAKQGEKA